MPPRPPEFFESHPFDHFEEETNNLLNRQSLQDEIGNCDVSFNKESKNEGHRIYVVFDKKDNVITEVSTRYVIEEKGKNFVFTNLTTLPDSEKRKGYASRVIQGIIHQVLSKNKKIIATQVSNPDSQAFWISNGFKKCTSPNTTSDFEFIVE